MPNPVTFPLNGEGSAKIDASFNGLFGALGPAGGGSTGVWTLMWCPNTNFVGSLVIMGRVNTKAAIAEGAPLVQIPYVAVYLNGVVPVSPRSWSTDPIVGTSLIEIPTGGLAPAVLFGVDAGYGLLYCVDSEGGYSTT